MKEFGPGSPMIVAEVSCNHAGKKDLAEELVVVARESGADAVKFQAYRPEDLAPNSDHLAYRLRKGPWQGRRLHELYTEARTPLEWLPDLYALARDVGLTPFSSVFHPDTVDFLEDLGNPIYKIASAEAMWPELKGRVRATGKQVVVSDGATDDASRLLPGSIVLRCVPSYPASHRAYVFGDIKRRARWGLSDHSCHPTTWIIAASLGAEMIEAHLRLDDHKYLGDYPLDYGHSIAPTMFSAFADAARSAAYAAHTSREHPEDVEFARRWVYNRDLPEGAEVTMADVSAVRCREGASADTSPPNTTPKEVRKWEPAS